MKVSLESRNSEEEIEEGVPTVHGSITDAIEEYMLKRPYTNFDDGKIIINSIVSELANSSNEEEVIAETIAGMMSR